MSHRREQKEALRREREEREAQAKAAQQRKRMVGYGLGGMLAIVVAAVLIVVLAGGGDSGGSAGPDGSSSMYPDGGSVPEQQEFDLQAAADAAGCELQSEEGSGVADHTTSLGEKVDYDSNPPTDGRHYEIPAEDGAYGEAPPDEALVHSLEHGRVIVWFKPNLPEATRGELKALFDEDDYQMYLVPRTNMPYRLAATAWNGDPEPNGTGRSLLCDDVNDATWDAIRTFRDEHRSRGPEPIP
jgi:hypothetical protein